MDYFIGIVNFLTKNPFGLIILSILSGVVGNWLFSVLKLLYKKFVVKYQHRSFVKHLVEIATAHVHGQRAVKIKFGTPAQAAMWAADYIINYIKHVSYNRIINNIGYFDGCSSNLSILVADNNKYCYYN